MNTVPRFAVTQAQIDTVVRIFYAKVRGHAELGPIFAAHVTDWPKHEDKIAGFWRNAIWLDRSYSGNPMRKHMDAGNVHTKHFPLWLEIFDEVLTQELPRDAARAWSALAHRIGRGLSLGLAQHPNGSDVPYFGAATH